MNRDRKGPSRFASALAAITWIVAGASAVAIGILGHRGWPETFVIIAMMTPYACSYNDEYRRKG